MSHFKRQRLEELKDRIEILKLINHNVILCAITGVAGSGKSELAKAYASELLESLDTFRWRLDPDPDATDNKATKVSYQQAYSELLYNFEIQPIKAYENETSEQMHRSLVSILWHRINQYSKWIVIFDNAGSYTDIKNYLPTDPFITGLILITTQQSHFLKDKPQRNFSLNQGLEETEAIQLLTELSGQNEEEEARNLVRALEFLKENSRELLMELSGRQEKDEAQHLVQELDYSPLGIRIAGCYIQNMETTFEKYTQFL